MSLVEARKNLQALYLEADNNLWEFKNLSTNSKTLLIENQFLHNELKHTQSVCESQKEIIVNLRSRISYFQDHDAPLEPNQLGTNDPHMKKLLQLEHELTYTRASLINQLRELSMENEQLERRLAIANQQIASFTANCTTQTQSDSKVTVSTCSASASGSFSAPTPSYTVLSEEYRSLRVERDALSAHCERLTQALRSALLPHAAPPPPPPPPPPPHQHLRSCTTSSVPGHVPVSVQVPGAVPPPPLVAACDAALPARAFEHMFPFPRSSGHCAQSDSGTAHAQQLTQQLQGASRGCPQYMCI